MSFESISRKLNTHNIIGWDIDETLINGPYSDEFRRYVFLNPSKTHWMVTFRDVADAATVWDELLERKDYPLTKEYFSGVITMPDQLKDNLNQWPDPVKVLDYHDILPASHCSVLDTHDICHNEFRDKWNLFRHWKAQACKSVGATVLVDDLEHLTYDGCKIHDVDFINSLTLSDV